MSGARFRHIRNLLTVAICLTILLLSAFTISIGYVSSPSVQALLEHLPLTISETLSSILVADEGVARKADGHSVRAFSCPCLSNLSLWSCEYRQLGTAHGNGSRVVRGERPGACVGDIFPTFFPATGRIALWS